MALFTDGLCSSIEDLTMHDSSVLGVASTEQIDVTNKLTIAHETLGLELSHFLRDETLDHVVVTSLLKHLHTNWTLELVYWDAYNQQLNDRYRGRWEGYCKARKELLRKLHDSGIGFVNEPVAKAELPELSSVPGHGPTATYFVRTAWVNSSGEEGAPSHAAVISISQGSSLLVKMTRRPANGRAWNVYVGTTPDDLVKQNVDAVDPLGTWLQPPLLLSSGQAPGIGQLATYMRAIPRILRRG